MSTPCAFPQSKDHWHGLKKRTTALYSLKNEVKDSIQGGISIFNKATFENTRAAGIGVLEIVDEKKAKNNELIFAPLRRTELTGDIAGPLASLCLAQTYRYSKEQCDKVLEARYRFPLPGDAAVTGVKVTFGDVEIQTELKDRQAAKEEYKEAKRKGEKAAMVTRESPDVFTICIAGLEPDTDVKVETSYVQCALAEGTGWSLRVPLTTPPRYVRKDEYSSRHAQGQPLAVLRDPGHRFAMSVLIHGASGVESPTHRLSTEAMGDGLMAKLQEGEVIPDRDCILVWKPKQDATRPLFSAMAQEGASGETYFLAMLSPPASGQLKKVPGEYILLVDHSGSMDGPKREAAGWAVEKFLLGLGEDDWFTLGVFDDKARWYSRKLVKADESAARHAVEFMKNGQDGGGTELGVALEQALDTGRLGGNVSRHLLIITDAEVTDAGRILRLVGQESRRKDRRHISLLCIDASPNSYLASSIAERGGGIVKFLTSSPAEGDISTALDAILDDWRQPLLAGLKLTASRPGLDSSSRIVHTQQDGGRYVDIGDLPAGRTIWVSGKVAGAIGEGITLEIKDSASNPVASLKLSKKDAMPGIKPLFGAKKLLGLEYLIHSRYSGKELQNELMILGYDPAKVLYRGKTSKLYPENSQVNETEALRGFIVEESLSYGLPSSETALIAVYHKAGKCVEATALVPNALSEGWSDSFVSRMDLCAQAPMGRNTYKQRLNVPAEAYINAQYDIMYNTGGGVSAPSRDIFRGTARFAGKEAVLFDSSDIGGTVSHLVVSFPGGAPNAVDKGLSILVFVDDMAAPRAVVRLADLLRMGCKRPLNLTLSAGVRVKVVLSDPAGVWAKGAPEMAISFNIK